jgi:lysophospholipase L1-like esterase
MLDAIAPSQLRPDFLAFSSLEFAQSIAPRSGGQLYTQRLAALKAGQLHTRLPKDSFREVWSKSSIQPTYEQWRQLLTLEARVSNRKSDAQPLSILVGDSLSLWFPSDRLPQNQAWLNQSISGDTTWNILRRLTLFSEARPNQIYIMVGINDLKMGASDTEILWNIQRIVQQLRIAHPKAKIIVQSILPTRLSQSINTRVVRVNRRLSALADREGASYLDLSEKFMDEDEQLMTNYTTDGLHLSQAGYAAWQSAVRQPEVRLARF